MEIGALLRAARQELRLDINQASQLIHIRVHYLQALEDGRLENLPGFAYTKGYLQAYAAFLHLDKDEILRRFEYVEAALNKQSFYLPQVFRREKSPSSFIVLGGLFTAVLTVFLWKIAITSQYTTISQIDAPPQQYSFYLPQSNDPACLTGQPVLYPPCHTIKTPKGQFTLLTWRGQVNTVLDSKFHRPVD